VTLRRGTDAPFAVPLQDTPMQFHHAGVATRDIDALTDRFGTLLDAPVAHEEEFEGMVVRFLDLSGGYLELLEPREGGPVDRFLDDRGPGIHHLAVATDDAAAALEAARDCGATPIDETPRPGAWGHDVAFLHPKSTGGVLLEFVEVH
jgi:methylmalonyl-CoA/ethylmalonyl-CoA epimerase